MCTVALFNDALVSELKEDGLVQVLTSLYQQDGMGIACLLQDGKILYEGGHDATPIDLVDFIMHRRVSPISWYCFHSRQATTAPRMRDDLVQPFINHEKGFALGHVGTIVEIDKWSIDGRPVSDGRMVFELADKYSTNPVVDLLRARVGTCAGFYGGNAFWLDRGYFYCTPSKSGVLLASRQVDIDAGYLQFHLDGKAYKFPGVIREDGES